MSKFNSAVLERPQRRGDTVNLAGGEAFSQSAELELASILLTSMVDDQYYRSGAQGLVDLRDVLQRVDPHFAAQAAVYARNEFGMRSISHATAGELASFVKGEPWAKDFYAAVVRRPDDITEILAYYTSLYGKPIPNSLKKGLARAFGKFDAYQLGKYRGEGKGFSLVDAVNLVHPKPTAKNADALSKLVEGKLRSTGTWETEISAAGNSEDAGKAKADAWRELLESRKIGYFALLRNLRNISQQAPDLIPVAAELLADEKLIRNSLVLPFRYLTALQEIDDVQLIRGLNRALDIALGNVPKFDGKTLTVIDHSGSMGGTLGNRHYYSGALGEVKRHHWGSLQAKGDLFGAALAKKNDGDVMVFGDSAGLVKINPDDTLLSITEVIGRVNHGHGTNFHSIFEKATKKYDRIVIFSDMQGWRGYYHPGQALTDYKRRTKADPFIYSVDLAGYGTMQFPENKVFALAGFSEKMFDTMKLLEQDRQALVNTIKKVTF